MNLIFFCIKMLGLKKLFAQVLRMNQNNFYGISTIILN